MSKVDVIMPQMGESIAEGTLTRWLKQIGETVERDEDLFEISTDKVDADIPSPVAGTLVEILVEEGATVEVNTVVARIDTEGGAAAPADPQPAAEPQDEAPAVVLPLAAEPDGEAAAPAIETEPAEPTEVPAPAASTEGPESREDRIQGKSTPLVRKIAAEHDVDLAEVEGSGIAGRVTRDDILAYIETRASAPAVAPTATPAVAPSAAPSAAAAPAASGQPGMMQVPIHGATLDIRIPSVPIREGDTVEEMSRVRLRTMEHMLLSKRISAHVTSVNEIDFEHVVRLRKKLKPKFAEQGIKLTYGPFIMKAVVEALREYPILNASVDGTRVVPVLKNADQLSLMGLTAGANELAEKARTKTLDFADIEGGSFTITNVGVFGNQFGMPIINQPQVAILGTGVIEKRPVVVQDTMGNDVVGIRHMSYFALSYDHRVVDGAIAAFWLNKVKDVLENFPEDVI
jgi:2-oxoglutarate dehydrogenase E2 component (dihydrolipoamide succinyltransferase)